MGKEQEIVINDGDDSQESEDEQIQRKDRIREVLDERAYRRGVFKNSDEVSATGDSP